ncbi:GRAM domain-containing protein isoform 2 [Schistosoma japonicum]|uniref:GRAM domain-containing protein isoform 2 n=1 Tax=Schistosoma japonicum TaxID=6182 RepID=A0A4Z2DNE1_SCHJA|nr:GRAM domain-containing protein isoform 2 [Schistosoma japonicum]
MSRTQLLSYTSETDPDFKSPRISTSCSHLPVKFTCFEQDQDDSCCRPQVSISNDFISDEDAKSVSDQFDNDESKHSFTSNPLELNNIKSTLSSSFASIPSCVRSVEYTNNQQNNSKPSSQDNPVDFPLTSNISLLSPSSVIGSYKLHQSSQNIPSIGLPANFNLPVSSSSTPQNRDVIKSSSTSLYTLPNQNVSKSSRSRTKRFANLYSSLTPSYRTKLEQFRRIFRGTPVDTDRLLVDYSCALSKNNNGLLLQGRMYITETWVCFYSKILYEQKIFLSVNEIVSITKEKTARVIPNAIQILYSKNHERFFFTSFASRERSYAILLKVWENCRNHQTLVQINQTMSIEEILQQIRDMYGDYSLAMVEDEEDTDGDPDLVPTTFPHRLRNLSDSSLSSHLTGTGRSKSISCEDVCHSDQPAIAGRTSKCSVLGTTDDELKLASDADIPLNCGPSFSDPSQFSTTGNNRRSQQLMTIKRCSTPDVNCHVISRKTPNEIMSDSFHAASKSGKEKKKRARKRRLGSRHHDEMSISKPLQSDYLSTHDPSPPDTSIISNTERPVVCGPGHDHPGRVYANTEIPLSVNALFQCIFTDSEFFSRFSEQRGTFGMVQAPWPIFKWSSPAECSNQLDSSSKIERTITYTLTLKQKLGPRTCTAVEQQTYLSSESESGKRYVIDAKVTNQAVPLCNCFCVVSRYCLLRIDRTTSRLYVSSQVIYEKPVFFGAKSIIENTCHSGLCDFFSTITAQLKEYATNLSLEERLTGGWLTQQRGCLNNITPSLNLPNIRNNPELIQGVNIVNQNNRKLKNDANASITWNANNNKVSVSKYPDQTKSPVFISCMNNDNNNNNTNVKRNNKIALFGSGDMTYLFMRPDRAWLLLVIISLLLCLFLSMVYNRLVVLEKLAEQFPSSSSRDRNHLQDLFGSAYSKENSFPSPFTVQGDRKSMPVYKDQSPEWARTRLKVMKDLIQLLSKTLTQMQQTLIHVQQGIELLEFPSSPNLNDNVKTGMSMKTPANTVTDCPDS